MASIIHPVGNCIIIFCSAAIKISAEIKSGCWTEQPLNTRNGGIPSFEEEATFSSSSPNYKINENLDYTDVCDSVYPITFHWWTIIITVHHFKGLEMSRLWDIIYSLHKSVTKCFHLKVACFYQKAQKVVLKLMLKP